MLEESVNVRMETAGTSAKIDVGKISSLFARVGAIPEASRAVNTFLAIKERDSTVGVGRNGLAGTHFNTNLGTTLLAFSGIHENDMIRVTVRGLDLAAQKQRVLMGNEKLAVILDLRPPGSIHQGIMHRGICFVRIFTRLLDHFRSDLAFVIGFE